MIWVLVIFVALVFAYSGLSVIAALILEGRRDHRDDLYDLDLVEQIVNDWARDGR